MTKAELEGKFMALAMTRMPRATAVRLMDTVSGLDPLADVNELGALLRVSPQ